MKTNVERVLDYLWSVGPQGATNAQIRDATGIEPHQHRMGKRILTAVMQTLFSGSLPIETEHCLLAQVQTRVKQKTE